MSELTARVKFMRNKTADRSCCKLISNWIGVGQPGCDDSIGAGRGENEVSTRDSVW
jgi:hypothetical protein